MIKTLVSIWGSICSSFTSKNISNSYKANDYHRAYKQLSFKN